MIEICEFLTVCSSKEPTGTVIEKCEDYNGVLKDFVLVLEPDKIPILETWIRNNVRQMQDHCIQMLENEPQSTFKYLMRMKNLKECTSEFVTDAGGIQQFLDRYGYVLPKEETVAPPEEVTVEEEESEASDTKEVTEQLNESQTTAAEPWQTSTISTNSANSKTDADLLKEELCISNETETEKGTKVEKSETVESTETKEPEPIVVTKQTTIVEETIHKKVQTVMDYNPDLISKISDGDIAVSLTKLKELNDAIALGGLDPSLVLTDEDLEEIYKRVYTYSPDVFKSFFLAYLKSVTSETERFRISAVVDDFVKFIGR